MAKTMTVNVETDIESEFRRMAIRKYGMKKGYLGKALTEAMKEWAKKGNADIETAALKLLKEGIKMKKWKFDRGELYER